MNSKLREIPLTALARTESAAPVAALIGPNALIQTLVAMQAMLPDSAVAATLELAGETALLAGFPQSMVDESRFVALVGALRRNVAPELAAAVLGRAGHLTGEYVLANRIPPLARRVLPRLPRRLALGLLLKAIGAHAWTFAGAGRFDWHMAARGAELRLGACPTARGVALDRPGCDYYRACFEVLLTRLVDPRLRVLETACAAHGAALCRFDACW